MPQAIKENLRKWLKVSELEVGMKIAVPRAEVFGAHNQALNLSDMPDNLAEAGGEDVLWDEIVSIEKVGVEQVWDIEVEDTHNFIAGHLLSAETGEQLSEKEESEVLAGKDKNKKIYYGGLFAHNTYMSGNLGIGVTAPAAYLNIKAGTTAASTAPLKFTTGDNLTTAEAGAMEYNGSELFFTPTGTTRETIAYVSDITTAGGSYQPVDDTLSSIALLGTAADKTIYTTGVDTWAETGLTAFGRSILDDADEATFKATVNLEIGTDVQAYNANLADLATSGYTIVSAGAGDSGKYIKLDAAGFIDATALDDSDVDHGSIGGLGDDDHSQYALLLGRAGGQTLIGGTGATDYLTLKSTSATGTTDYINFLVGDNGGTEAMRILTSGYVGIGTTAPAYLLDITASTNNYLSSIYNSNTGSSAGGLYIRSDGTGNLLTLNYAGSDVMTVTEAQTTFNNPVNFTSTGDVFISYDLHMTDGTAGNIIFDGPGYIKTESAWQNLPLTLSAAGTGNVIISDNLDITGQLGLAASTTSRASLNITTGTAPSVPNEGDIYSDGTDLFYHDGSGWVDLTSQGAIYTAGNYIDVTGTEIAFDPTELGTAEWGSGSPFSWTMNAGTTDPILSFRDGATTFDAGNVGIGTTSPANLLHVMGSASGALLDAFKIQNNAAANTANEIGLELTARTDSNARDVFQIRGNFTNITDGTRNSLVQFQTANAGTFATAMSINAGNVGIGTTAPGSKLHILHDDSHGGITLDRNSASTRKSQIAFKQQGIERWSMGIDISQNNTQDFFIWDNVASDTRFYINSSGNIGIGTTAPTYKLDLNAASGYTDIFRLAYDGSDVMTVNSVQSTFSNPVNFAAAGDVSFANDVYLTNGTAGNIIFDGPGYIKTESAWQNLDLTLSAAGTGEVIINDDIQITGSRLNVASSGNVGIGTTAPVAPLNISRSGNSEASILIEHAATNQWLNPYIWTRRARGTLDSPTIVAANDEMFNIFILGYDGGAYRDMAGIYAYVDGTPGSNDMPGRLEFHTTPDGSGSPLPRMVIKNDGNVGIGTTAPASLLDVTGGLTTVGSVLTLGTNEPSVVANDVLGRLNFYAPLESDGSDSNLVGASILAISAATFSTTVNNTSLQFQTGASETATTKMSILSGGNVGIGTTAPTVALHVVGNGRFTAIGSGTYSGVVNRTSDGTLTTATSDARLKTNIEPIENALEKVMGLRGITYNWIDPSNPNRMMGMIAQEVLPVAPELVFQNNVDGYYGMFYGETSALLVEAIKEQQVVINEQGTAINEQISELLTQDISFDDKITLIGGTLDSQGAIINEQGTIINSMINDQGTMNNQITDLESQMADLKAQAQSVIDFSVALRTESLLYKDETGNLNLEEGTLEASGVVAGAFTVKISDPERKTIGTAEIASVKIDEDLDGYDDLTLSDGKEIKILTKAVSATAKIFLTPQGNPGGAVWTEKTFDATLGEYTGFTIYTSAGVGENVKVDWFIIEEE